MLCIELLFIKEEYDWEVIFIVMGGENGVFIKDRWF